ncbi:hypothetical protein WJX74_007340 [Apatococcus lobatus]|uniref:DUF202 domain-containing protein n=1 Tax=Apatococcus lobatus TaxID=904363 RepID=A0AAW1RQ53_9CHLO
MSQTLRRTEAKAFFANERTFLHWMNMSVTIGSISAAMLGIAGHAHKNWGAAYQTQAIFIRSIALCMLIIAIFMACYATWSFKIRGDMLLLKQDGPYDSQVLPLILTVVLMVSLLITFGGSVAKLAGLSYLQLLDFTEPDQLHPVSKQKVLGKVLALKTLPAPEAHEGLQDKILLLSDNAQTSILSFNKSLQRFQADVSLPKFEPPDESSPAFIYAAEDGTAIAIGSPAGWVAATGLTYSPSGAMSMLEQGTGGYDSCGQLVSLTMLGQTRAAEGTASNNLVMAFQNGNCCEAQLLVLKCTIGSQLQPLYTYTFNDGAFLGTWQVLPLLGSTSGTIVVTKRAIHLLDWESAQTSPSAATTPQRPDQAIQHNSVILQSQSMQQTHAQQPDPIHRTGKPYTEEEMTQSRLEIDPRDTHVQQLQHQLNEGAVAYEAHEACQQTIHLRGSENEEHAYSHVQASWVPRIQKTADVLHYHKSRAQGQVLLVSCAGQGACFQTYVTVQRDEIQGQTSVQPQYPMKLQHQDSGNAHGSARVCPSF